MSEGAQTITSVSPEDIRAALAAYRDALSRRDEHRAEFGPVFQVDQELSEEVEGAKRRLLELMNARELSWAADDSFEVSRVVTDRGSYNPDRLPRKLEVLEACTLTIDRAAVRRLVRRGVITEEEAAAAWEPRPAKPYLRITPIITEG